MYVQLIRGTNADGSVRTLPGTRFVVGRSADCAIRLTTSAASRKHAILEFANGVWMAKDLKSRNGLFLNGHQIGEAEIRPLDKITFGKNGAVVRIVSLDPAPPMEAGGLDATRAFQSSKLRERLMREADEEPLDAIPVGLVDSGRFLASTDFTEEVTETTEVPRSSRGWRVRALVLAVLGLAFGGVTAFWVWPQWWFPYKEVLAPITWGLQRIWGWAPAFMADSGLWVARGLCTLWFGLLFTSFARPLRWLPVILLLVGAHLAALYFGT